MLPDIGFRSATIGVNASQIKGLSKNRVYSAYRLIPGGKEVETGITNTGETSHDVVWSAKMITAIMSRMKK